MSNVLEKKEDCWELRSDDGEVVDKGDYPLRESEQFIETAAELLNNWKYQNKPYKVIDNRHDHT